MRYDKENNRVSVSAREIAAYTLLPSGGAPLDPETLPISPPDPAALASLGLGAPVAITHPFAACDYNFLMTGECSALASEGRRRVLTLAVTVHGKVDEIDTRTRRLARTEGHLLAYAAMQREGGVPHLTLLYIGSGGELLREEETLTRRRLESFFERVTTSFALIAGNELDRKTRRLPAMSALAFPYRERRLGQEELMHDVYHTVTHRSRLFASAPTGIGKTVSTLYPAVRAMGAGHCDKVFYLTAKATAARMAGETAALLGKGGALRAVMLASKERICPRHGRPCREGAPCENSKAGGRLERATAELWALDAPLITPDEIGAAAARHGVCPHELSLSYSQLADVVICDYNYLFDPAVRLARYFVRGGRWCFLIDEAHNLPERIRDTYTVSLSEGAIAALTIPTEGALPDFFAEAEGARRELLSYFAARLAPLADERDTDAGLPRGVRRTLPEGLLPSLFDLAAPLERIVREGRGIAQEIRAPIRRFYYELKTILDILELYDEGFRLEVSRNENGEITFRTLCLDTAGIARRCLADGESAVLFSATLSPMEYYRTLLGGDAASPTLELPSPFERDNLAVCVMDKLSTRYADRDATLAEVAAAVLATARARRGNYMVFCPSFAYAERLADALRGAKDLRLLCQGRHMSAADRTAFLAELERPELPPVLAVCVLGGIFSEGVDLAGDRLIGAVIVGVGLGTPEPLREQIADYFQEKNESGREYAYLYPGMNRILQAAGRVIRAEGDVGAVVLIDDRYATPFYRSLLPPHWRGLTYCGNVRSLAECLRRFWAAHPEGGEA